MKFSVKNTRSLDQLLMFTYCRVNLVIRLSVI